MYEYQVWPNERRPLVVVRALNNNWLHAQVWSDGVWRPSTVKAGELFAGFSSTEGDDISEEEALALAKELGAGTDDWVDPWVHDNPGA